MKLQKTPISLNTDILKYPLFQRLNSGYICYFHFFRFQLVVSQTADIILIIWDQKIYFEILVVLDKLRL